jgi:hypothetical protein
MSALKRTHLGKCTLLGERDVWEDGQVIRFSFPAFMRPDESLRLS